MNRIKASGALGLAVFAGMTLAPASAAEPGWYLGGNVGQSQSTIDDQRIIDGLRNSGFATTGINDDDRDLGYKLFGGYQFNSYFALESGYFDLGKFAFTATTQPPGTLHGTIRVRGIDLLDLVGTLPITRRFSVFGRAGAIYTQTRDEFNGSGSVHVITPSAKKYAINYKFGVGLEYDITPALGLRAEAERYRVNDAVGHNGDVDLFSGGLLYRFGMREAQPAEAAQVAESAPPPPPASAAAAAPPPPPPAPTEINLSADSLFAFNKAVINPAGERSLDALASKLKGVSFDDVQVIGYTDRIGSPSYNLALSKRRAEAVKDYLVRAANISADKITATGEGSADSVTRPGDCPGKKVTPKLIACLQPDRRVEIKVSGTHY